MKIIDNYITGQIIKTVLLALLVLVAFFAFLSVIDQLEATGRGNYTVLKALQYVFLTTPRLAYELFPIAAVIGGMTVLGLMCRDSELAVIRTSGVSRNRLALSMTKGGLVIIILTIIIGELIAPFCEQKAQHLRSVALTEQITLKSKYGFWSRDGLSFINIRTILPGDRMEEIYIYEFDKNNILRASTYAKHAQYDKDQWILEDIERTNIYKDRISIEKISRAAWESLLDPDVINLVTIKPQYLTLWGLYNYIRYLKKNEQNSLQYEQALWSKLVNPFIIIFMIILAIPLVKSNSRTTAVGQRIFIGCLAGIGFHLLNQTAGQLGVVYEINPAVSVTLPVIFLSMVVFWLINRHA